MNKLKSGLLFFAVLFFCGALKAQTLEDGKKFMYYERYKSAKGVFEKLVAANPNNIDAVYWLGQSLIVPDDNKDIEGAKSLYQKTLMNNSNSALLLAGMGHVELLEGKIQDARNRFETAISISQGKNKDVLNAVGFANVNAEKGDADYAVAKLKQATELKKMNDPDVWINLGEAYKKLTEGGPAQTAFETALSLNPNYARASYRIGKIYQTQGEAQRDIFLKYYNDAIAKDAVFAPVYENLYQYYYKINVDKSADNLEKYIANSDENPKNCYYRASMKFAQAKYAECISKSDECIAAGGTNPYPSLYALKAYAYDRLGDSVSAKTYFETYFAKQKPEKIGSTDLQTYAKTLLKFVGNDSVAGLIIDKAVILDSTEKEKVELLKSMTTYYEGQKMYKQAADWYSKINAVRKEPRKGELHNAGYNYFKAGDLTAATAIYDSYVQKFPDESFGYYMRGKVKWATDSTMELGLANPDFEKTIEYASTDTAKFKRQLIDAYKYFIVYNVYKRDKNAALSFCDKVLALDSADAETVSNKELIPTLNFNAPKQPKKDPAGTKPATGKAAEKSGGKKAPGTKKK